MNKFIKNMLMAVIGASLYLLVEIIFRNYTFRLSAIMAAIAFVIGNNLNNKYSWKMDLLLQCGIIAVLITGLEATIGNLDYYFLHQNMWDYSGMPLSALNGKICIPFTIIWFIFGFFIVFAGDAIEYYWFHDNDRPEYWILGKRIWQMPVRKCDIY